MKLGFVYSGQGSQKVGMGKDFYSNSEIFKSVFDLLEEDKREIAFNGPMEDLSKTINTQGIMTAFAVGVTDMLKNDGITPKMSMGLSLGEYSALYSANVFSKEQVIDIINYRAKAMTQAAQGVPCKMAAILMLDKDIIEECCKTVSTYGVVSVANLNCPGQIVISGQRAAVEKAAQLCQEKGARRVVFLETEGAFHTTLMNPAHKALEERFKNENFNKPSIPVVLNTIAESTDDIERLKLLLALQVKNPVDFESSIRYMKDAGIDTVIEIGQGKTLAGFIKKTAPEIKVYNIEDTESYNKVVGEIKENLKG